MSRIERARHQYENLLLYAGSNLVDEVNLNEAKNNQHSNGWILYFEHKFAIYYSVM
jgi:hypothetical protein